MKNTADYAEQIDRDFADENYFENIIPPWLGRKDESFFAVETVPELPEAIRQLDEEIPPIEDEADVEELSTPECADPAGEEEPVNDISDADESCEPDVDFADFDAGQEEFDVGPYAYWGYEDEPEHEELFDDDTEEMILQESFCYADAIARTDDDGWFYED